MVATLEALTQRYAKLDRDQELLISDSAIMTSIQDISKGSFDTALVVAVHLFGQYWGGKPFTGCSHKWGITGVASQLWHARVRFPLLWESD